MKFIATLKIVGANSLFFFFISCSFCFCLSSNQFLHQGTDTKSYTEECDSFLLSSIPDFNIMNIPFHDPLITADNS